jgi:folate-binding protein YgfZ
MTETTQRHESALLSMLVARGGATHDYHGQELVRHFGDPAGEYAAATEGVAVFDRSHRSRLSVTGRSPAQMMNGVLTGTMPTEPVVGDLGLLEGRGTYHAVLTPKGRMVSDLTAYRLGAEDGPGFLLDVPVAGHEGLLSHFGRYMPPRFARVIDVSAGTASISVVGPTAAEALAKCLPDLGVDASVIRLGPEGHWLSADHSGEGLIVVRTQEVWPEAWTVFGPEASVKALWRALVDAGVTPAGLGVWATLRVEAGRPVYGTDMDDRTIPPEAGIVERAIDQTKGCYTGQEVIVRIRDRGHVNRNLRRLELGEIVPPARGTELHAPDGSGKVVGEIRSVVQSPRFGGVLALAYVRRGVDRVMLDGTEIIVPSSIAAAAKR